MRPSVVLPRLIPTLLAALLSPPAPEVASTTVAEVTELRQLYSQRNFFALRNRLDELAGDSSMASEIGFLRAATLQAFNRLTESTAIIGELLARRDSPPELGLELQALRLTNSLRQHRYRAALESARLLLASPVVDRRPILAAETRNKLSLLETLSEFPPQQVSIDGPTRMALGNTRLVPLTINDSALRFALDTGANFSVIARSQAESLHLAIRPAGLVIATSTAQHVVGDVTIADRVDIGNVHLRHVVFLVLPDDVLSFDGGKAIPGLVGFPVVEAMREVRFRRDNVIEIPQNPPRRSLGNLALDELEPLTLVRYRKDELLCRLDTGAAQTVFYEPFYRRYGEQIRATGHAITATAVGIGGAQQIPAYRLQRMALTIAAAGIDLRRVEVYTRAIRRPDENYLYCNIGRDALDLYRAYTINFEDMALTLE